MDNEATAVLKMKYTGRRFCDMDGIQFKAATKGLMSKITSITGWRIPEIAGGQEETKNYETVFTDQLNKFIYEQCGVVTLSELEYAIRKYGVNMSDWGRPMHLGLLSACLTEYLSYRATVSELEEQHAKMPLKQTETGQNSIEMSKEVDWSSEWNKVIYGAKIGQIKNVWITADLYYWLIRIGKIEVPDPNDAEAVARDKADKWETIKQCAAEYLTDMKDALLSGSGTEAPYETKRRIALLENIEAPIWKKDTVIMSALSVMAKKEIVRQLAISEALNDEE